MHSPMGDAAMYANVGLNEAARNVTDAPPEQWTDSVLDRLRNIRSIVTDADAEVRMVSERMFGVVPEKGESAMGSQPLSGSKADEINRMIDDLHERALEVTRRARRFNSRL